MKRIGTESQNDWLPLCVSVIFDIALTGVFCKLGIRLLFVLHSGNTCHLRSSFGSLSINNICFN